MKLAIILGTRPEIVKMAPIVRACEREGVGFFILHTGQHHSPNMDAVFFDDLELPRPTHHLDIAGQPYRLQVGTMVREISRILREEHAGAAIVQGDTNTVLAGALAASKCGIPLAHHEAGLRSHDLSMPEEKNRILTDHIADFLFTPTPDAARNLHEEGIPEERIAHTGNTIVDAVLQHRELAARKSRILEELGLQGKEFFLATAHRAENVDIPERLQGIMEGLARIHASYPHAPVIFSLHPRTRMRMEEFRIPEPEGVRFIDPVGFLDFLTLEAHASLIVTDSGGIQEEASILRVPCVTVRDNTERPETIGAGINVLAGTDPERILAAAKEMLGKEHQWRMLFGDGDAGVRIVRALKGAIAR